MEFKSSQRDLLDHSFSLSLSWPPCTNNNQTGPTILWYKMAFSPSCVPRKHLKEICGHFLFFQMLNVSRLSKVAGRFVSICNSEKREQIPGGKTEPKFNTCLQPFLVFVFVAQNEILHAMERVYHWALHCLFSAQYLSINGFNNFSKICIGILHVSKQCFFEHLWMAF